MLKELCVFVTGGSDMSYIAFYSNEEVNLSVFSVGNLIAFALTFFFAFVFS